MANKSPYDISEEMIRPSLEGIEDSVIRNRYITDEVKIVAVGWFYYCVAAFQLSIILGFLLFFDSGGDIQIEFMLVILCISSLLFLVIGYGMRHFLEWARKPSMVAAIVGMFMFPLGTLAGIYCLFLLRRSNIEQVFSQRYRTIVAAENYKSMAWLAFVTGVLLGFIFWGGYFFISTLEGVELDSNPRSPSK